jgi:hypothetical protein
MHTPQSEDEMKSYPVYLVALMLSLFAPSGQAAIILDDSSQGIYNSGIGTLLDTSGTTDPFPCANSACGDLTVVFPTEPNLSAASSALGAWLTNSTAPGGTWSASVEAIPFGWAANTETAIIYAINAGTGIANLSLLLGVDNGIFVWLDGDYLFGARGPGASVLGEYSVALPNLTGTHYLQLLREDHGSGQGFDIQLSGNAVPAAAVPEPGTMALLTLGMVALALRRRT